MTTFDDTIFASLFAKAEENPRKRMNYDLRTSADDSSQRMLNALLPGTIVPIHRHPKSDETVVALKGRLDEIFFDEEGKEINRIHLCPAEGICGVQIPIGMWHTVEVLEPSVILESKDGRYGQDGSESMEG